MRMMRDADIEAIRSDPEKLWAVQTPALEKPGPIVWEAPKIQQARDLDRAGRVIQVLVLVKTMPQLSAKYNDTVCVAGLALDPLRWVRLYPVPFRYLERENQFTKYAIIEVGVCRSDGDARFESLKVDASSIEVIEKLGSGNGWNARARHVEQMEEKSMCELCRNIDRDIHGPSLALTRPERRSLKLELKATPPETPEQARKRRMILQRQALDLGLDDALTDQRLVKLAEPPYLAGRFHFKCDGEPRCRGHALGFIDWEFVAIQHHNKRLDDEELRELLVAKFVTNPTAPGKDLRFFLGNLHDAAKRKAFQVLGLYYPSEDAASGERFNLLAGL